MITKQRRRANVANMFNDFWGQDSFCVETVHARQGAAFGGLNMAPWSWEEEERELSG